MFIPDKHTKYHKRFAMKRLAAEIILCCIGTRVILLVQFPPTEDFHLLENFKISSHFRSFRKGDNFDGSFASISLNT